VRDENTINTLGNSQKSLGVKYWFSLTYLSFSVVLSAH